MKRPVALMSAMATLFAALFICLGATERGHQGGSVSFTPTQTTRTTQADAQYICPYGHGACRLFPHLSPAVLTVPPPAAPLAAAAHLPGLEPPYAAHRMPLSAAAARAPDLHVLQVLRT